MRFSILTLFPEMFSGPLDNSMVKRAQQREKINIQLVNIRDFAPGPHRQVDDGPFGGGPGMVFKPDVLDDALDHVQGEDEKAAHVVYMSPQGSPFRHDDAVRLAGMDHLVLVCGHYEGIDERVVHRRVDEEISLGDFVLTGGEIPAMAVVDAVTRFIPGVLGDAASAAEDSFYDGLLDCPHYTRPASWQGTEVPPVLRSGNHGAIDAWRRRQALLRTLIRRPDLLKGARLTRHEKRLVEALAQDLDEMEADSLKPKAVGSS